MQGSVRASSTNLAQASVRFWCASFAVTFRGSSSSLTRYSQFKLTLTILERFLAGLDLKYLRLDGDTPQIERGEQHELGAGIGQILVRLLCRHVPRLEFVVDEVWASSFSRNSS
jgi:hypothetical protein